MPDCPQFSLGSTFTFQQQLCNLQTILDNYYNRIPQNTLETLNRENNPTYAASMIGVLGSSLTLLNITATGYNSDLSFMNISTTSTPNIVHYSNSSGTSYPSWIVFTSNGSFTVSNKLSNQLINVYMIGGGGGGGGGGGQEYLAATSGGSGGGGASGVFTVSQILSNGTYTVNVGQGGTFGQGGQNGNDGKDGGNGTDSYILTPNNTKISAPAGNGGGGGKACATTDTFASGGAGGTNIEDLGNGGNGDNAIQDGKGSGGSAGDSIGPITSILFNSTLNLGGGGGGGSSCSFPFGHDPYLGGTPNTNAGNSCPTSAPLIYGGGGGFNSPTCLNGINASYQYSFQSNSSIIYAGGGGGGGAGKFGSAAGGGTDGGNGGQGSPGIVVIWFDTIASPNPIPCPDCPVPG